jgi:hypothetical protein
MLNRKAIKSTIFARIEWQDIKNKLKKLKKKTHVTDANRLMKIHTDLNLIRSV